MGKPPTGVIFDCDMGNSPDDALALALLYGFDGKNEMRVVSVSTSKSNLKSAALCEAIGRFYAGAVSAAFAAVGRTLPIGMSEAGISPEDTPILTKVLARPEFVHGINHRNDTADPIAVIRNAFTSQYDQNCVAVLTGPATNMAGVLNLPGAKELIARKAKFLSVMGGAYPAGDPEWNVKADIKAAQKLFAEWPTPIVASGFEVGNQILYPGESIEKDFAWSPAHPVAEAYRAYKPMPYDFPTWDMTAVLYAAKPDAGYFKLSEPGTITVRDDGRTEFKPSADGRHRYLIFDPEQKAKVLEIFTTYASAKPVPRQPRFRRPVQEQKQTPPPKPPEAKP
jgi:inosine-uridine nucleoside N-ribohydrolase